MNAKELFLNISQIVSAGEAGPMTWPTDFNREAVVHISRSAKQGNISHITLEFAGVRAKFLSCLIFDGAGNHGTGVHSFAMPRIRTTVQQKALGCLSVLNYLIDNNHLDAEFSFYADKIMSEINGGVGDTLLKYEAMCQASRDYLAAYGEGRKVFVVGAQ